MVLSSLKSRKDELTIALLEDTLFLNPAPPLFGSDDAAARSISTSDGPSAGEVAQAEPANDKLLRGQVSLVIGHARRAKKIRVQLVGRSAAHGGDGSTSYEARTTLDKNLEIDLKGEKLEKGTHTWDFSFIVPSTTAVSERSVYGSIRYSVRATLYGAANVRDLSSTVQPLWLIANPSPEGELPSGLEIDVRHNGNLRPSSSQPHADDVDLGPIALHISSPHLTVASLLFLSVTFERPPEGLKIMSVSAFILQSFDVTFVDKSIPPVKPPSQKKLLFWVDSTSPIAESTEDLLEKPNLSRGTLPPLAFERRALLAQPLARLQGGHEWTYARVSRVPDDDAVRPSTLAGTTTPIRVHHRLVMQIKYRLKGQKKDLVLEMSTAVTIASCCCLTSSLLLPRYRSQLSAHHPSHHGGGGGGGARSGSSLTRSTASSGFLATDGPLTPFHRRCLCNTPLQALVDQEGEAIAGAAELRSRSRSNSHSRSHSRARNGRGGGVANNNNMAIDPSSSVVDDQAAAIDDEESSLTTRGRLGWNRKAGETFDYPRQRQESASPPSYDERDPTSSSGGSTTTTGQSFELQGLNLNPTRRPPQPPRLTPSSD
ncbi:hypothetical protein JCM3766R1_005975 [Sporobolomyces carnicolor]